jgi:hypothetical protein
MRLARQDRVKRYIFTVSAGLLLRPQLPTYRCIALSDATGQEETNGIAQKNLNQPVTGLRLLRPWVQPPIAIRRSGLLGQLSAKQTALLAMARGDGIITECDHRRLPPPRCDEARTTNITANKAIAKRPIKIRSIKQVSAARN